ncbi:hypothetical protein [Ekhidna sp.]
MKEVLENITVEKLLSLQDPSDYEVMLYLNTSNELKGHKAEDFLNIEYGRVIKIRQFLEEITLDGLINMFEWVYSLEKKELLKLRVKDFYPAFNHIITETNRLVKAEEHLSEEDHTWKEAGGERMAKYGVLGVLVALGQQFGIPPFEVEKWSYGKVFTLLRWNKEYNEVVEKYRRIKSRT